MKITKLRETEELASFEVRNTQVSYRGLLRAIRHVPGAVITQSPTLRNDGTALVRYKNAEITIDVPFADYVLMAEASKEDLIELVDKLRAQKLRWWERIF